MQFLIKKNPPGGCALARKETVAFATALGARVPQAEPFFKIVLKLYFLKKHVVYMYTMWYNLPLRAEILREFQHEWRYTIEEVVKNDESKGKPI